MGLFASLRESREALAQAEDLNEGAATTVPTPAAKKPVVESTQTAPVSGQEEQVPPGQKVDQLKNKKLHEGEEVNPNPENPENPAPTNENPEVANQDIAVEALKSFLASGGYEVTEEQCPETGLIFYTAKKEGKKVSFTITLSEDTAILVQRDFPAEPIVGKIADDDVMSAWFDQVKTALDGYFTDGKAVEDKPAEQPAAGGENPNPENQEGQIQEGQEDPNNPNPENPAGGDNPNPENPNPENPEEKKPLDIAVACPECKLETTLKQCKCDGVQVKCPDCGALIDSFEVPGEDNLEVKGGAAPAPAAGGNPNPENPANPENVQS